MLKSFIVKTETGEISLLHILKVKDGCCFYVVKVNSFRFKIDLHSLVGGYYTACSALNLFFNPFGPGATDVCFHLSSPYAHVPSTFSIYRSNY